MPNITKFNGGKFEKRVCFLGFIRALDYFKGKPLYEIEVSIREKILKNTKAKINTPAEFVAMIVKQTGVTTDYKNNTIEFPFLDEEYRKIFHITDEQLEMFKEVIFFLRNSLLAQDFERFQNPDEFEELSKKIRSNILTRLPRELAQEELSKYIHNKSPDKTPESSDDVVEFLKDLNLTEDQEKKRTENVIALLKNPFLLKKDLEKVLESLFTHIQTNRELKDSFELLKIEKTGDNYNYRIRNEIYTLEAYTNTINRRKSFYIGILREIIKNSILSENLKQKIVEFSKNREIAYLSSLLNNH